MKKSFVLLAAFTVVSLSAQELPTPSSKASIDQRIGLTDIRVDYHRPNVNDRAVFGDLVSFGDVWRTGANKATSVTFSTEVMIMEDVLPAGTYSLFTIPNENMWTIIFNTETELWGTGDYKQVNDVLRVDVDAKSASFAETFTIGFEDVTKNSGILCLTWAETSACLPIQVDVESQALENIRVAVASDDATWGVFRNSASYYMDNNIDNDQALTWMKRSVELKDDNWYSLYLLGKAYHVNGDRKNAKKTGKNALKLYRSTTEDGARPYEGMLEAALEEWKKK